MKKLNLDLKPLLRKMSYITKKDVGGLFGLITGSGKGQAGSRRALVGTRGFEFEKFREFADGDDADKIDWIASLRAQKTLVRVYSEEQNKDIIFFLDVSSSMSYSSHGKLKNEYAAELVASLSYAMSDSGDNLGLVMFTDHIVRVVPPASGKQQFMRIVREVSNSAYYEGPFDLKKAMSEFINYRKRPAVMIIISDFIGLKPGWEDLMKILVSSGYEVLGMMVRDPMDDSFPATHFIGQVIVSDPFSSEQILMDPNRIAEKYRTYNENQLKYVEGVFRSLRSRFIVLHTDESFVESVGKMFIKGQSLWK
jgi:uncharacterized protein (DUF58 family)